MTSLFVSMSFVTPLDFGVVNYVTEVDHQPAVMMRNQTQRSVYTNLRPCVTRFVFLLRPFERVEPTVVFPHFTPTNGGNSATFNEGPGGFLALSNPFTITNTSEWTVSIIPIIILIPPLAL